MEEIRAFVGHSFNAEDADVVNKFLKYFDQLSKSQLQFSWEHAQAAEPRELAEKVLALLADKNVLIAICTKRERVIEETALKATIIGDALKGKRESFDWKTSDWIIQEIGLAKGRNLEMVLLVENGVRPPGGLQGNVEYISFDRASPERSFGAVLEMLTALVPKARPSTTGLSLERRSSADENAEKKVPDDEWLKPKPSWGRVDYEFAFMYFASKKDGEGAARINDTYLSSADATHNDNNVSWQAFKEFIGLKAGQTTSLAKLRELAAANPKSSTTLRYLAGSFAEYKDFLRAASTYESAATIASDRISALSLLGSAAVAYAKAGAHTEITTVTNAMRTMSPAGTAEELQLLKALRRIADATKDNDTAVSAMERIVELEADETDTRFSLAYLHSELGNHDLALRHYLRIPQAQRGSGTWNNLGVAFNHFAMSAKAIEAYRFAAADGDTLAMSNIAREFIAAGFLSEAGEQCQKALEIPDYNAAIGHDLARIKEIPDEENEILDEILKGSSEKAEFYRQMGNAMVQLPLEKLPTAWNGPDGPTNFELNSNSFSAQCEYEITGGLLYTAFGGPNRVRYRRRWEGIVSGRAIFATVARDQIDPPPAPRTLLSIEEKSKVLLFMSADGRELHALESPHAKNATFYSFTLAAIT